MELYESEDRPCACNRLTQRTAMITATSYFHARLAAVPAYKDNFSFVLSITLTTCNVIFLLHATLSSKTVRVFSMAASTQADGALSHHSRGAYAQAPWSSPRSSPSSVSLR